MPAVTKTFNYTGTLQQATIPPGTASVDVYLWGGAGGGGSSDAGGPGGGRDDFAAREPRVLAPAAPLSATCAAPGRRAGGRARMVCDCNTSAHVAAHAGRF